jgi:RimJ/RimL family protein N-acetyltransferase
MEQEAAGRWRTPERADEVTLRPFDPSDVDAMAAWASDPVVLPTASTTWCSDPNPSRDALLAFLRDTALPHPWYRAACLPGGAVVGAVSVTPTDDRCRAEVGIVLARAHWGEGATATAALRRAVSAAFGELEGVERVEALVDADDAAARRVLEDARFRLEAVLRSYRALEGRLRDVAVFSVVSTDLLLD